MSQPDRDLRSQQVSDSAAGERLDRWLALQDTQLSRSRAQHLNELGLVRVDGRYRPSSHRLRGGEHVEWIVPSPEPMVLEPDPTVVFEIAFEDEDLVIVDKPAGLVVHPAPGHRRGTLIQGLLARFSLPEHRGDEIRPGMVHRLDRDTSGLLVVAKNDLTQRALQDALRRREIHRVYLALCWGVPCEESAEIDLPLDRHPTDRLRRAVVAGGRPAQTHYEIVERFAAAALLRLRLRTGRTHQIRVHLAEIGHPVLGDELYGGGRTRLRGIASLRRPGMSRALRPLARQALHACELGFVHPRTRQELRVRSQLPEDFQASLQALRDDSPGGPRT